ncbi:uncharacterized protein MYCFIDRAFT_196200 [Pseudocercospora fijiensis CIRAD86]|uniref:DUF7730 domain-containing protein n=1 Tax=Pseudocercospora fijiensis (strain CIRAD86) TaxID=383855 RepID=M2YYK2_PSEFD|nr:uncharacterized protein MYCFIDRAFT_196200 [Pseudocercospora fijiensis CIRAD86]EME82715.1 hypothetical protein MYCFIDRAFT_196200 [Pseudocercospora fijiensis CIRAD86]
MNRKLDDVQEAGTFSKLPPEIRNMIYALVLCEQKAKDFDCAVELLPDNVRAKRATLKRSRCLHLSRHPHPASCLAILQTCRAISHEASGIFYGNHDFTFHDDLTITPSTFSRDPKPVNIKFRDFLWTTSSARLHHIAEIQIIVTGALLSSSDLARLPNLKELAIGFRGPKALNMFKPGSVVSTAEDTSQMRELCKSWIEVLPKLEHITLRVDDTVIGGVDRRVVKQCISELQAELRGLLGARNENRSQSEAIQSSE